MARDGGGDQAHGQRELTINVCSRAVHGYFNGKKRLFKVYSSEDSDQCMKEVTRGIKMVMYVT